MKAVLFDLDGVLINSFNSWYLAFNETLEKFGRWKISKEEFEEKCWGPDLRHNMGKFGLSEDAIKYCQARHIDRIKEIKIFPEVKEVLELLRRRIKLGLVTNTPANDVHETLEYFGLKKYFDVVVTGDDVKKGKPNPEIVVKACNKLGLNPSDVVLVGDTKSDIVAGKLAGCTTIGLRIKGDFEIEKLSELVKFIK
jgi:HAD superfamily hydrolase (TIGR01509 family)